MSSPSDPSKPAPPAAAPPPGAPLPAHVRVWTSETLLDGQTEVAIVHDGQVYRLRCTRQGKLILYK
jgi:hemin uptake protein HemP